MSEKMDQIKLRDGTLIRHKVMGYEGRIDGTTEIKGCFTRAGELLDKSRAKEVFQYRVLVKGETMRRIAPAEDFEILEGVVEIICPSCHSSFRNKPGLVDKPAGRCQCGGWICPSCLACAGASEETAQGKQPLCPKQRKRVVKKLALLKKARAV